MSSMQDAINAHLEELKAVVAASGSKHVVQVVSGEVVGSMIEQTGQSVLPVSPPVEVDEDSLADIIRARMVRREQFVATRDARDAGLRQRRDRLGKNEANLRNLYREKPEFERLLGEEVRKLAEAEIACLTSDIPVLQAGVEELTEDVAYVTRAITALETRYPELKVKLDGEQSVVLAHRQFLERFVKEEMGEDGVRYTASGTPNPGMAEIKTANIFLEASIKEASAGHSPLIVLVDNGMMPLFVSYDGKRWAPKYPQSPEGAEVCRELAAYEKAIQAAEQKKLQIWADRDVEAGLLLTSQDVTRQKKDPQNRHNIVNMVRFRNGFCFIPVMSKKSTGLPHYCGMQSEIKVEYGDNPEGTKQHMLRVTAVTTPQFVEDFFFPEEGKASPVKPTFYFDDLHEISTWRRINPVVRDSLTNAVRWAESKEREVVVMEELSDVSRVSDLRTIHQLADGAVGTAVIYAPKPRYGNGFAVGFQMVSDGVMVRPGSRVTDKSKKLSVYEAILDGKAITEFFARAKDNSFVNDQLQEITVRNEVFELGWLVPLTAIQYNAEQVSHANVLDMVMPFSEGGRDSTYVCKLSVNEKRAGKDEGYREVAYVITRTDDKLTFVTGLTHYSVSKLVQQGFALNTPYNLGELRGYVLHVLQRVYCRMLDVSYDNLPEHLKGARAKSQIASQDVQDVQTS